MRYVNSNRITCQKLKVPIWHVNSSKITCQKSKVSFCHIQFLLYYLSKVKSLILTCTIPPKLPVKNQKSQFDMYNSSCITRQKSKASI